MSIPSRIFIYKLQQIFYTDRMISLDELHIIILPERNVLCLTVRIKNLDSGSIIVQHILFKHIQNLLYIHPLSRRLYSLR